MVLGRRRLIQLFGVVGALGVLGPAPARPEPTLTTVRWRGIALGAEARITLNHAEPGAAKQLLRRCAAEIRRLEAIFSLYRPDSAISRLNRAGRLVRPPFELLDLIGQARAVSALTDGAFDLSVQPLWQAYAAHFADPDAAPDGPEPDAIDAARALVDHRGIEAAPDHIRLARPGMAISANGIAQGYITDRVAELLRAAGVDHVLVDLGEIRAVGDRGDGAPWSVGFRRGVEDGAMEQVIQVDDRAVATSDPAGTRFSSDGSHHHLFDPRTGRPAVHARPVTVIAPTATRADALSTAFAVMPPDAVVAAGAGLADIQIRDAGGRRGEG